MKSLVRTLFDAADATVEDTASAAISNQRIDDSESGVLLVYLNQSSGGATNAHLQLEGRFSPDDPWVLLEDVDLDGADFTSGDFAAFVHPVLIVPQTRAVLRAVGGAYTVPALTTITVKLME